jgi:hypothetical protein
MRQGTWAAERTAGTHNVTIQPVQWPTERLAVQVDPADYIQAEAAT